MQLEQSENAERAKQLISQYPEIFDSLREFERTKKLPKLYRKKRIDATIDENILRQFKEYGKRNAITLSRFIEQAMLKELTKQETKVP